MILSCQPTGTTVRIRLVAQASFERLTDTGKEFESFLDLARSRYNPVEEEKLNAVLEAARLAPTAANRQPIWFIGILTAGKEFFQDSAAASSIARAPPVRVDPGNPGRGLRRNTPHALGSVPCRSRARGGSGGS